MSIAYIDETIISQAVYQTEDRPKSSVCRRFMELPRKVELRHLNLRTLEERRNSQDLTEVFKFTAKIVVSQLQLWIFIKKPGACLSRDSA